MPKFCEYLYIFLWRKLLEGMSRNGWRLFKSHPSVNSTDLLCLCCWSDPLGTLWAVGRGGRSPCFQGAFFTHLMSKIYCISGGDRCMEKINQGQGVQEPLLFYLNWNEIFPTSAKTPALRIEQHHEGTWHAVLWPFTRGSRRQRQCPQRARDPVHWFIVRDACAGEWEIHCLEPPEAGCWAIITYRRPPAVCCAR